jgi:hypothetical protein
MLMHFFTFIEGMENKNRLAMELIKWNGSLKYIVFGKDIRTKKHSI